MRWIPVALSTQRHEDVHSSAHGGSCCADIPICDIRFILPEDISVGSGEGCTSRRHFIVRVDAQYLDSSVPCSCSCSGAN